MTLSLNCMLKQVTVEPLLFTFYFAFAIFTSASFPAFYNKICVDLVSTTSNSKEGSEQTFDYCQSIHKNETAEALVQDEVNRWGMYNALANFIPSLLSTMVIGSYGDKHGRKVPALLGGVSLVLYTTVYNIFLSVPLFPVWSITVIHFIIGFLNYQALYVMSLFSYIADIVDNEDHLTVRYTILTAFWSTAYVIGGYVSGFLLEVYSTQFVMLFAQCVACLSFFFTLVFMKKGPKKSESSSSLLKGELEGDLEHSGSMYHELLMLVHSCYATIIRIRPLNGRLHLVIACGVMVIYASEDSGTDPVFALYAFSRGFSATLLSWYFSTMALIQMVCSLVGSYMFKLYKWEDTTIVVVGMLSTACKMITNGLAPNANLIFAALLLGCLSTVGYPAMRAFVVRLGVKKETGESESGELLSLLSVVTGLSPLFSAVVYNNVYSSTIDTYKGAALIMAGIFLIICAGIILVVHWDRKRLNNVHNLQLEITSTRKLGES